MHIQLGNVAKMEQNLGPLELAKTDTLFGKQSGESCLPLNNFFAPLNRLSINGNSKFSSFIQIHQIRNDERVRVYMCGGLQKVKR